MPPVTYSGRIINEPLQEGEPDATVIAIRPGLTPGWTTAWPFEPVSDEDRPIGETHSSSDGGFVLTTPGGYATRLWVTSSDERMAGAPTGNLKYGGQELPIKIRPRSEDFSYSTPLSEAEVTVLESAFDKIVFNYAATRYEKALSLNDYRRQGVISQDEFLLLEKQRIHLVGRHPAIEPGYAHFTIRIPSFTQRVEFLPRRDLRYPLPSSASSAKTH